MTQNKHESWQITTLFESKQRVESYNEAELSQRWPRDAPYIWAPCRGV